MFFFENYHRIQMDTTFMENTANPISFDCRPNQFKNFL